MKKNIVLFTNIIVYGPLWVYFFLCNRNRIREEAIKWFSVLSLQEFHSDFHRELWLLGNLSEFRSLLYFRYRTNKFNPFKLLYPGTPNPYLPHSQRIGNGLVIQHGFSTIFNAEKIGDNCQVWQGVTIGKAHSGEGMLRPVIGNNVKICCNSIVLGNIIIGDNVTIGAGAVITKSVPCDCVVVGNPARIICKDGKRVNIPL